jgi:hypothetical protein
VVSLANPQRIHHRDTESTEDAQRFSKLTPA